MRNNYQQSEDSVTKISRSKSRNQVNVVAKLREKVDLVKNFRKAVGISVSILTIFLSTIFKTNLIHNVLFHPYRFEK